MILPKCHIAWTINPMAIVKALRAQEKNNSSILLVLAPVYGVASTGTYTKYAPADAPCRRTQFRRHLVELFFSCTLILFVVLLSGCGATGPRTIKRDQFDYLSAISDALKRQTLLNLLKTRYQDVPVFLDIASVINQYSIEKQFAMGLQGELYNRGEPSFIGPSIEAGGRFTDRPTITYSPLNGKDFARTVMSPIPVSAILTLIQSGYPADYVFRICTQSIQGLENRRTGPIAHRDADPAFYELLQLFRKLADKDYIAIRTKKMDDKRNMVIVIKPPESVDYTDDLKRFIQLLGLNPDVREFTIVTGRVAVNDREIAIFTRALIQVMIEYAAYIDVPEADIAKGCVYVVHPERAENDCIFPPLIKVRNGIEEPREAYVAVPYRKHWFWIEDGDLNSKAMFSFLMFLNSFTETVNTGGAAPVISIPTN